jgi:putative holliday junction resolvase
MPRILAIDYGLKRCGIAVTDTEQRIATALTTVETKQILKFLTDYFAKENVECVVVGEPKQMDYSASETEPAIKQFIAEFSKLFPLMKLERFDERFTSKIALRSMIDSGVRKKERRDKALVDRISATIILQSYMESRAFGFQV